MLLNDMERRFADLQSQLSSQQNSATEHNGTVDTLRTELLEAAHAFNCMSFHLTGKQLADNNSVLDDLRSKLAAQEARMHRATSAAAAAAEEKRAAVAASDLRQAKLDRLHGTFCFSRVETRVQMLVRR